MSFLNRHFASSPNEQLRLLLKEFVEDGHFKCVAVEADNLFVITLDLMRLCEASPELASLCAADFAGFEYLMKSVVAELVPDTRQRISVLIENLPSSPLTIADAKSVAVGSLVLIHSKISKVHEKMETIHSSMFVCGNSKCHSYGDEQEYGYGVSNETPICSICGCNLSHELDAYRVFKPVQYVTLEDHARGPESNTKGTTEIILSDEHCSREFVAGQCVLVTGYFAQDTLRQGQKLYGVLYLQVLNIVVAPLELEKKLPNLGYTPRDPISVWTDTLELVDTVSEAIGMPFWSSLKMHFILCAVTSTQETSSRPLRCCGVGQDDYMPHRILDAMQRMIMAEEHVHHVKGAKGCLGVNLANVVEASTAITIRDLNSMKPKDLQTILAPEALQNRVLWAFLTKTDDSTIYDKKLISITPLFDLFSRCELELNRTQEADARKARAVMALHRDAVDPAAAPAAAELLQGYLHASRCVEPTIDEDSEATRLVRCYYAEVRKLRIDPLPGQELLQVLVTLATTFSKIGLRDEVDICDVCAAIAIVEQSTIVARGYESRGLMGSAYLSDLFEEPPALGATAERDPKPFEAFCEDVFRWTGFNRLHMLMPS